MRALLSSALRDLFLEVAWTFDSVFHAAREALRPACSVAVARILTGQVVNGQFIADAVLRAACGDPVDLDCRMGMCPMHCKAACGCGSGGGGGEEVDPPDVVFDAAKKKSKAEEKWTS